MGNAYTCKTPFSYIQSRGKILTQEVPSQSGTCHYEDYDGDNDEGKETLAGPSLPDG